MVEHLGDRAVGSRLSLVLVGLAWAAVAVILLMAAAAGMVLDRPFGDFSRDPTAVLDGPAYIGFVSSVGSVGWALGCGACLVGALTLQGWVRLALVCGGLLTAILMADDLFLIHEAYVEAIGIPMKVVPLGYACLAIGYIVVFREFLRRHGIWLLPLSCSLFAFSAALDVTLDADAPFLLEDGAKLFGIVTWSSFFVAATVHELGARIHAADAA